MTHPFMVLYALWGIHTYTYATHLLRFYPSCFADHMSSSTRRFFVPPEVKQLQMTGRLWRHGLPMMPHMMAGIGGPSRERPVRHRDAAPTTASVVIRRARGGEQEELDDGHGRDGAVFEPADEVLPDPVVPDVVSSVRYQQLFGDVPLHEAVLDVYCRMAALGGRLMGDNMADTARMSEQQMRKLASKATSFVTEYVDVLFGPAHTTKAHRLAAHLHAALLDNGNLWEGDTSENEGLHGPCKRMYQRTNKRGPTIVLQMMRAAEAQTEVLRELRGDARDDGEGIQSLLEEDVETGDVPTAPVPILARSHRGLRVTVSTAAQRPGMGSLGALLQQPADSMVVLSPSFTFFCIFEWGARSVVQTACATDAYMGKPRYDYIWYSDKDGARQLGLARLVVRMLGGAFDDFVVVQRLQPFPPLPRCSLSRSGCRRMAWRFSTPEAEWPELAQVPLARVLRLEHVVLDFLDLADRHGLRALPSNIPDSREERRVQRYFTNHFYPFTSRALNPSS